MRHPSLYGYNEIGASLCKQADIIGTYVSHLVKDFFAFNFIVIMPLDWAQPTALPLLPTTYEKRVTLILSETQIE